MGRPLGSKNKGDPIKQTRQMIAARRSRSRTVEAVAPRSRTRTVEPVPPSRNRSMTATSSRASSRSVSRPPSPPRRSGRRRSDRCALSQPERIQILAEVRQHCTPGEGRPKYPKKSSIRDLLAKADVGLGAAIQPTTPRIIHDTTSMMQDVENQHLEAMRSIKKTLTYDMKNHEPEGIGGTVEENLIDAVARRTLGGLQKMNKAYTSEGYELEEMWDRSLWFLYVAHHLKLLIRKIADLCMLYMRVIRRNDLADDLTCYYKLARKTIDDFHFYLQPVDGEEIPIMTPRGRAFFERENPLKDFITAAPEEVITLDDDDL